MDAALLYTNELLFWTCQIILETTSLEDFKLMPDVIAPEFARFVSAERRAGRLPALPGKSMAAGELSNPVVVDAKRASEFVRVAARRSAGLFHPTKRREIIWVDGDRELAVSVADLQVKLADGLIKVLIPVLCDQTGATRVEVAFAVGSAKAPSGLFASTFQRPSGPPVIVSAWGDALVAFAWQCLLGLVTGLAGAVGKDSRGNVLVPVELSVSARTIQVVPMARHRFSGARGLRTTIAERVTR
jgi:hypothetical protein